MVFVWGKLSSEYPMEHWTEIQSSNHNCCIYVVSIGILTTNKCTHTLGKWVWMQGMDDTLIVLWLEKISGNIGPKSIMNMIPVRNHTDLII